MRQEFHSHKIHVARLPSIVYSFSNRAMKLCAETGLTHRLRSIDASRGSG
jgi:hypothetical protein